MTKILSKYNDIKSNNYIISYMTSHVMNITQSGQFVIINYLKVNLSFIIYHLIYLNISINFLNLLILN